MKNHKHNVDADTCLLLTVNTFDTYMKPWAVAMIYPKNALFFMTPSFYSQIIVFLVNLNYYMVFVYKVSTFKGLDSGF